MQNVVLVACVGQKLDHSAPAADLYQSIWFKKVRRYAELKGSRWYILSALHGLLRPEQVIAPYNYTLMGQKSKVLRAWADSVFEKARTVIRPGEQIVIIAGRNYYWYLEWKFRDAGYSVEVPTRHLGIGQQLKWLTEQVSDLKVE